MGTRNFIQTPVTHRNMAMNAAMYGFAEHSTLTPHYAVKQLWWTDSRIEAKVDRRYVMSVFRGAERDMLEKPVGFEELSDDTYLSWILDRARRLFLILSQIRRADRIFGLIDDSWQDDDLPLSRADVRRLELAPENDEKLNRRFYEAQFQYLLRPITEGAHVEYGPHEHIPMEYVFSVAHSVSLQNWHRVHFPDAPDKVFVRRRFDLVGKHELEYLEDVQRSRFYRHQHIARVYASYTSEDAGYTLTDHVPAHTLKTFIEHRNPPQFTRLSKAQQPRLLLEWMHCLADTIAYLHHRGDYHGAIRPSNILIDDNNRIAFSDLGHLRTFRRDKPATKEESRDYAAPELKDTLTPKAVSFHDAFAQSDSSSFDSNSAPLSPRLSHNSSFSSTSSAAYTAVAGLSSPTQPSHYAPSPTSPRNFSRHFKSVRKDSAHDVERRISTPPSPPTTPSFSTETFSSSSSSSDPFTIPAPSRPPNRPPTLTPPQSSDIFSLGSVYLDMLTFIVHGKLTPLTKLRGKKYTAAVASDDMASISSRKSSSSATEPFHASPDRVDAYLAALLKASAKHPLAACVAELLRLVRGMLARDAARRPAALEVRNALAAAARRGAAGAETQTLCCAGRAWDMAVAGGTPTALAEAIARCRRRSAEGSGEERWDEEERFDEDAGGVVTRRSSNEDEGERRRGLFRGWRSPG